MIVEIQDNHQNYVSVRINTKTYIRHKNYSKINFLKYADVKFILKIPIIYRKTWDNKWVLVDYNDYIDPVTKKFLVNNVLRDSIIRHPFVPLKYLKKKKKKKALRKATKDDYRKLDKRITIEVKEDLQNRAKFKANLDKLGEILQALAKNDAEYKNLLKRKKAGESVEDLITKNREHYEKLKKEDKEHCEISKKWMRTEEGEKTIKRMFMRASLNPNFARSFSGFRIKRELGLKLATLNDKIQKNEDEYENLLERKNKGDYVDDLIKQNRYIAESLKKSKESCEKAMGELKAGRKTDWKSKIVR